MSLITDNDSPQGDFDSELNLDYHQTFDNQSNIVSTIAGGAVASVADFGASVWNSLPFTEEVATEDLLAKVSANALRVYEEHPDAIHAASFIGGMFVPAGLAMKGMNALRAGTKGANWFSKAGRELDLKKVDELFLQGPTATKMYRQARNEYFAKGLANQTLDAVVAEAAIVGTMSAHPLMEDYMADPVKNFAIGAAFGGVIGGGLGHIADRFAIKNLVGTSESNAYATIFDELKTSYQSQQNATQVQIHEANIKSLDKILQGKDEYNELTREIATKIQLGMKKSQADTFEAMLSPELKTLPPEVKHTLLQRFATDGGMQGVEEIGYMKAPEVANVLTEKIGKLQDTLIFNVKKSPKTGAETIPDVAFYPEFNRYASPRDFKHYSRARDLGKDITQLEKELGKDVGVRPNVDFGTHVLGANSAVLDGEYVAKLSRFDKMSVDELSKIAIAPDDLPTLNAVIARVSKEPDAFEKIKFIVTRNQPNYGVLEQQVIRTSGVAKNFKQHVDSFTNPTAIQNYDMLGQVSKLSPEARGLLQAWRNGPGVADMRLGADAFFRGGYGSAGGVGGVGAKNRKLVEEMYNSPQSVELRKKFMEVADADGNVYLWRGIKSKKAVGHAALESYTTDFNKAAEFGRPSLYKVHVDDILGSIADLKSHDGLRKNEVIVGSPARQTVAQLPTGSVSSEFAKKVRTTDTGTSKEELSNLLISAKEETINLMLKKGVPLESIAIRTNTPLDTVIKYASAPEGASLIELGPVQHYSDAMRVAEYMDQSKRALRLKSNVNKVEFSKMKSGLDQRMLDNMHKELSAAFLAQSKSNVARKFGEAFFGNGGDNSWKAALDMLRSQVSNFVNTKAGSAYFNSFDFFVRDMGDVGATASVVGKRVQQLANDAMEAILKPVREGMESVVKTDVERIEFNTAMNIHASTAGHRIYEERQFWKIVKEKDVNGKEVSVRQALTFNGQEFKVVSDKVDSLLKEMANSGREMYELKATINKMLGKEAPADIGFWAPSFNPRDKFISYVWDKATDTTKLLWANTEEDLAAMERAYKATIPLDRLEKQIVIVSAKSDQPTWSILNSRMDSVHMEVANLDLQKAGAAAPAIVKSTADIFGELAGGYEHYINSHIKQLADISMHDVTDALSRMSEVNQHYFKNQALGKITQHTRQPRDAANVVRNTLLGNTNLQEFTGWKTMNEGFETGLAYGVRAVSSIWKNATAPLTKGFLGGKKELTAEALTKLDYEKLAKEMEAKGIVNPWKAFDDEAAKMYGIASLADHKDASKRLVYASNAFAATVALRIGEVAQPLVNAMSLPILTGLAIANKMPETFMGIAKGTARVQPRKVMMEGMHAAFSKGNADHVRLGKMWEDMGFFKPMVSEANETLALARGFDPSMITKVEKAIDSNMVNLLSKGSDFSEGVVRKVTMHTGAILAKRLYPELDDVGVTIFARDFMDRAVGNYHAAQRPVMFQGTLGVALGLFQTYMVTMAQNIYRGIELKNYKALAKAALTQSTIFGGSSLPGFQQVSELIGEHYSDPNYDLTTGTYRAFGNDAADTLLYGLPSKLTGAAFYTRGELNPRFANVLDSGVKDVVGVNFAMQGVDMVSHVAKSVTENGYPEVGRAFMEALSMQSISRPVARLSEVATGYAVTRQGNTVSTPEEIWTATGIMARVLSTRHLEEAKLRQSMHLNSYYGSIDREARQELMGKIKTALRNGSLNEEMVAKVSEEYLRKGGTPTGWRSAYNTAIAQSNVNGKAALLEKLDPEHPLNHMIENLD